MDGCISSMWACLFVAWAWPPHLDVADGAAGQGEGGDVLGLTEVAVQPVDEVHHVVLGGVDLPQRAAQRAPPPLELHQLGAPALAELRPLLLRPGPGGALLGALGGELRPQRLRLLPQ